MPHPGGRPLKFPDPEKLQQSIDAYFDHCDNWIEIGPDGKEIRKPKPYTVSGLALWLDVETDTLRNYEKRDEFFGTIKRAKQRIEESLETKLHGNNVTGIIFNLKNNYGWKDRTDVTTNDKEMPAPIIPLNVLRNDSNQEDSKPHQED